MRWAYFLQGILFIGIIIIAVYALQSKNPSNQSVTIEETATSIMTTTFSITSPAFENNGRIPSAYTCDGDRKINPPLAFSGVPEGAKSIALIMDDPDVPKALHADGVYDHWVLFNIPPSISEIGEGKSAGTAGANGSGLSAYTGPCPPPQYEPSEHRYIFRLYALDTMLMLKEGATKQETLKAMEGHIIEQAELIGKYKRL